jgi:hypothetical protein
MMVTFGEPIREQGHTTKEGKFWKDKETREICDSEADEEEELPQGAKSLHMGGLVFP